MPRAGLCSCSVRHKTLLQCVCVESLWGILSCCCTSNIGAPVWIEIWGDKVISIDTNQITFKTLLLTFKALHNLAPTYLSDLLWVHAPSRSLRSSTAGLFFQCASPPWESCLYLLGTQAFECTPPSHNRQTQLPHSLISSKHIFSVMPIIFRLFNSLPV